MTFQKSLFSHTFLCHSSFFLLQRNKGKSDNKNHHDVQKLFLLIELILFLLQDNAVVFLRLKSFKEQLVFHDLIYVLKHKHYIFFSFLSYKTLGVMLHYFSQIFSNHFFLMENLFHLSYIYTQKVQIVLFFADFFLRLHDLTRLLQCIENIYYLFY